MLKPTIFFLGLSLFFLNLSCGIVRVGTGDNPFTDEDDDDLKEVCLLESPEGSSLRAIFDCEGKKLKDS